MTDRSIAVRRVLWVTFLLNEGVAVAKIAWGLSSGSVGMLSDGFHSMSDGVSNLVGIVGIALASRPPDEDHPYGHRKFETLFSVGVGALIMGTCFEILRHAYRSLSGGREARVDSISFTVMAITIGINIYAMSYERRRGLELGSEFLTADAMHTKSNVLASAGVVAGLVLTRAGFPVADSLSGLVIAVLIALIGVEIIRGASDVLVDKSLADTAPIEAAARSVAGVLGCHAVRTRGPAGHACIDLHIQLDPHLPLHEAHAITHRVEAAIMRECPEVADVVLHTEPYEGQR